MKRIILIALLSLFCISSYSQTEWEMQPCTFKITPNNSLDISNVSSNGATLHNWIAESKDNKKQNRITARNGILPINIHLFSNDPAIRVSFNIQDIHNNPSNYKYAVQNENGKTEYTRDIYWGITVYMTGTDGKEYNMQTIFYNSGARGGNYGLVDTSQPSSQSFCMLGYTPRRGTFNDGYQSCNGLPSRVEITLQEDRSCLIDFDNYSLPLMTVGSVVGVKRIEFNLYAGAKIRVYNFKVERQSIYARVSNFISAGDNSMNEGSYRQAASEYSKAIDRGYKNYDIYFKRANAYFASEFYNNAIDDCTKAISYKSTTDAYLLRGKAKLLKSDASGIDDLKKGGSEGLALIREMELDKATTPNTPSSGNGKQYIATGSGFVLTSNGVIVTNYHVIDGAKGIDVLVNWKGQVHTVNAKVLISDKTNDISLLQIDDSSFTKFPVLPYAVKTSIQDVGTSVFALGYPMSDILGEEIKVTDGIISSRTGYQGDIVTYQISAPIQSGNSGGPLFDKQGNIVGITNAGVPDAQNVGYAIKTSYLKNLIDVAPTTIMLPANNSIAGLPFTEKIKRLTPYVVLIKIY